VGIKESTDTIAAIATAPGRGGIGVIRVSGPHAPSVITAICGLLPQPRLATLSDFMSQGEADAPELLDRGIVLFFQEPHSFTGEHVAEFHAHGGPVVLDLLLDSILRCGVRLARPGEFSERAYLNGKMDLAQAEAIADLIDSTTAQAARNAVRSLQGAFSQRIHDFLQQLISLRMYIEASIDFPEEEVDFLQEGQVSQRLQDLQQLLQAIEHSAHNGVLMRDGLTLVLAGKPNAGKSSLMNALAGRDTAIVTAIAGTTRDVLREQIQIEGMPLHIVDTAGLHESPDEIEREGMRRALEEVRRADRLLLVIDSQAQQSVEAALSQTIAVIGDALPPVSIVLNKCDLTEMTPGLVAGASLPTVAISALTGAGIDALRQHLKNCVGFHSGSEAAGDFSARRRHLDAIARCETAMKEAADALNVNAAGELVAEHLRLAQQTLGEITGEFSADDLLGEIFSSFCIGK
jgi:tRNA modification GTPase